MMLAICFVKAYANRSTPKRSCPVLIFNIRYNHKREKKLSHLEQGNQVSVNNSYTKHVGMGRHWITEFKNCHLAFGIFMEHTYST